jgi:hypothetical protein
MIISSNSASEKEEFQNLLHSTLLELNRIAKTPKDWNLLKGDKLEPFIEKIMIEQAVGTLFENSIECTSAQDFPDIVAKKYYGVEVKSTTSNHWKTTGNSVLESTRKDGVERIYMLFGKLGKPIEFRCRPYEECLSEVVVTHSPRYLIDMNLPEGSTIFDKMKIGYDELRKKSNPLKSVILPITKPHPHRIRILFHPCNIFLQPVQTITSIQGEPGLSLLRRWRPISRVRN